MTLEERKCYDKNCVDCFHQHGNVHGYVKCTHPDNPELLVKLNFGKCKFLTQTKRAK